MLRRGDSIVRLFVCVLEPQAASWLRPGTLWLRSRNLAGVLRAWATCSAVVCRGARGGWEGAGARHAVPERIVRVQAATIRTEATEVAAAALTMPLFSEGAETVFQRAFCRVRWIDVCMRNRVS